MSPISVCGNDPNGEGLIFVFPFFILNGTIEKNGKVDNS